MLQSTYRAKKWILPSAVPAVEDLTATFESLRLEDELNKLISYASVSQRQSQTLVAAQPTLPRRCRLPTPFSDGQTILVDLNSLPLGASRGRVCCRSFQKIIYRLFVDTMLNGLKKQFTDQACQLICNAANF